MMFRLKLFLEIQVLRYRRWRWVRVVDRMAHSINRLDDQARRLSGFTSLRARIRRTRALLDRTRMIATIRIEYLSSQIEGLMGVRDPHPQDFGDDFSLQLERWETEAQQLCAKVQGA